DVQIVKARGIEQALGVFGQPEKLRALRCGVNAFALEHRGAVMQCMRAHVHAGFVPGLDAAVVPKQMRSFHGRGSVKIEWRRVAATVTSVAAPDSREAGWRRAAISARCD